MADVVPVLAIDGPTGSGKGTVSRALARRLNWHLLDSGVLYRLVALAANKLEVALDDTARLAEIAETMDIEFSSADDVERVFLESEEVAERLRTESCGAAASQVAAQGPVRKALLKRQRGFAQAPGLVADGRDMGTVVFPNALVKVFLTASPKERAIRRYKQLKDKGIDVSLAALSREVEQRDRRDAERDIAPLRPAEDARVLDSTGLSPDEVVARILGWLQVADSRGEGDEGS